MNGPADFGPIYAETNFAHFPVEPWNTASNLIFAFILIYFAYKTKFRFRDHQLLVGSLPILLIGFIGGSLFHATRASSIYLIMDFVPIFLLAIAAALSFWLQIFKNKYLAVATMVLVIAGPRFLLRGIGLDRTLVISAGYLSLAIAILLPALLFCAKNAWRYSRYLIAAILSFTLAISFRVLDAKVRDGLWQEIFPMGTHFLWHIFGGVSVFFLMKYIYLFKASAGISTPSASPSND